MTAMGGSTTAAGKLLDMLFTICLGDSCQLELTKLHTRLGLSRRGLANALDAYLAVRCKQLLNRARQLCAASGRPLLGVLELLMFMLMPLMCCLWPKGLKILPKTFPWQTTSFTLDTPYKGFGQWWYLRFMYYAYFYLWTEVEGLRGQQPQQPQQPQQQQQQQG